MKACVYPGKVWELSGISITKHTHRPTSRTVQYVTVIVTYVTILTYLRILDICIVLLWLNERLHRLYSSLLIPNFNYWNYLQNSTLQSSKTDSTNRHTMQHVLVCNSTHLTVLQLTDHNSCIIFLAFVEIHSTTESWHPFLICKCVYTIVFIKPYLHYQQSSDSQNNRHHAHGNMRPFP